MPGSIGDAASGSDSPSLGAAVVADAAAGISAPGLGTSVPPLGVAGAISAVVGAAGAGTPAEGGLAGGAPTGIELDVALPDCAELLDGDVRLDSGTGVAVGVAVAGGEAGIIGMLG